MSRPLYIIGGAPEPRLRRLGRAPLGWRLLSGFAAALPGFAVVLVAGLVACAIAGLAR